MQAGEKYTIVKGDTLWDIAAAVYGSGWKYTVIWDANKQNLRSGNPNLIFPGEVIWIPPDNSFSDSHYEGWALKETGSGKNEKKEEKKPRGPNALMQVSFGGETLNAISGSLTLTLDTPANGATATVVNWADFILPFQYEETQIIIDGKIAPDKFNLYRISPKFTPGENTVDLEFFTPTADILDSTASANVVGHNIRFSKWLNKILSPLGIHVKYDAVEDPILTKIKLSRGENLGSHIKGLAEIHKIIISNTTGGGLRAFQILRSDDPVVTLNESEVLQFTRIASCSANYDGRTRFRTTTGYSTKKRKKLKATYVDPNIPRGRSQCVSISRAPDESIEDAVKRVALRGLADSFTFQVELFDWVDDYGDMYEPGKTVYFVAPSLYIKEKIKLIIRKVVFTITPDEKKCILDLVHPSVYNGSEVVDIWNTE